MAVTDNIPTEIEVFGVSYERYALQHLFKRLTDKLQLKSILEIPASGAKAMPSLYSLGFALAGCDVSLVDADTHGLEIWSQLQLTERLAILTWDQVNEAIENGQTWDLSWNFMVVLGHEDPKSLIELLARSSHKWILLTHVNRFNVGFSMHRTVHRLWKIPWTHGDIKFFSPFATAQYLRQIGLKNVRWGVVDCPPWPDSPGFRDLRLHRLGDQPKNWVSPYVEYLQNNKFPGWMKWVYVGERLPIPNLFKLPYSHLFYIIGQVNDEAS
jgi:hypothetical protein